MKQISLTPFGRQPVSAGLLAAQALARGPAPQDAVDKWALLRDLTAARRAFGVTDRDLGVLAALISFHPGRDLTDDDALMVFPSNAALSDRAHGMAESTLRRHIAALVRAGLILRHDSPNGKRYATRDAGGNLDIVYGFNLRPLLVLAPQIGARAQAARAEALHLRNQRAAVVIRLRDATKLIEWAEGRNPRVCAALTTRLQAASRALRRKLPLAEIEALASEAGDILRTVQALVSWESEEMGGNDNENERHNQNSNTDLNESELCEKPQKADGCDPAIPLSLVLKAAPDIIPYAAHPLRSWRDLSAVADFVRPMLGISPNAWKEALSAMGGPTAAITLACILQNADRITSPGGYLRALTQKADAGGFSPGPMVMALLRNESRQCA